MSRYIDAEKLKIIYASKDVEKYADAFNKLVDAMPTADVIEVVRCKDCKYREGSACDYSAVYVRPNGYCQWGEKEDE